MADQKPKINFPTNIPVTVRLGTQFWSGEGQYGMSYGWNMTEGGVEKSCFVKPYLNDKLKAYPAGTELTITKKEVPGDGGRPRTEWHVVQVGASAQPMPTTSHSPAAQGNTRNREDYRQERIARAEEAINDAMAALHTQEINENVRALAISFLIDEQRQGIAPPADEPF